MATHSSVLAWRIPGTGNLVGCRLWGRTESDTTEATEQQQQHHWWFPYIYFSIVHLPQLLFRPLPQEPDLEGDSLAVSGPQKSLETKWK